MVFLLKYMSNEDYLLQSEQTRETRVQTLI